MKLDPAQLKSLVAFLNTHDGYHLDELQDLIYKAYDDFVKIYQRLIPALAIQYCKEDAFDLEVEGSTTSSFDSVKQFYLNVYEALGNLLIIPVALNNIKYFGSECVFIGGFYKDHKGIEVSFLLEHRGIHRFLACCSKCKTKKCNWT